MNLGDPELELVDPTPNVHALFLQFDKEFFWTKLASRAVVRWSKRMYSCAGICSYEGRGGLCDIALSEPLLKLRPRKDLIETLLHEMIHAFLFITCRDQDRDGHGPNFQAHMHRINKAASLNISIYHSFHDEVELYQTHWWRCNGPCQKKRPHFGIVRRSCNRAPGPHDYWWSSHKRNCGGTFIKIKEPEKKETKKAKEKTVKPDITKFVTKDVRKPLTPIINKEIPKINTIFSPQTKVTIKQFDGVGKSLTDRKRAKSIDVVETVRNVWANKQIISKTDNNKHKKEVPHTPAKRMKIDDYFGKASSLIKDLYGDSVNINKKANKQFVVSNTNSVNCPVCSIKVTESDINRHLDECLNKKVIDKLCKNELNNNFQPMHSSTLIANVKSEPVSPSFDAADIERVKSVIKVIKAEKVTESDHYSTTKMIKSEQIVIKGEKGTPPTPMIKNVDHIKSEPSTSKINEKCPCCGLKVENNINDHLDQCSAFDNRIPTINDTIIIDDDDVDQFDESLILNETGTKSPCPCCMEMIEQADMNDHLDICLS